MVTKIWCHQQFIPLWLGGEWSDVLGCWHSSYRVCKRGNHFFPGFMWTLSNHVYSLNLDLEFHLQHIGFPAFWRYSVSVYRKLNFFKKLRGLTCALKESLHSLSWCTYSTIWIYSSNAELWCCVSVSLPSQKCKNSTIFLLWWYQMI